jgi:hypothetical protein
MQERDGTDRAPADAQLVQRGVSTDDDRSHAEAAACRKPEGADGTTDAGPISASEVNPSS